MRRDGYAYVDKTAYVFVLAQAGGRADVVVECSRFVYVMELKRDGTAAEALAQVDERGYADPYRADPREKRSNLRVVGADSGDRAAASGRNPWSCEAVVRSRPARAASALEVSVVF